VTSSVLQRGAEQRRGTGPGAMRSNSASSFLSPTLLRPCQCSCPGNPTAILLPPQKFLGMDIGQQYRILQQPQNATSFGEYMRADCVKLEHQERAYATDTTWRCSEKCASSGEEAQKESQSWGSFGCDQGKDRHAKPQCAREIERSRQCRAPLAAMQSP